MTFKNHRAMTCTDFNNPPSTSPDIKTLIMKQTPPYQTQHETIFNVTKQTKPMNHHEWCSVWISERHTATDRIATPMPSRVFGNYQHNAKKIWAWRSPAHVRTYACIYLEIDKLIYIYICVCVCLCIYIYNILYIFPHMKTEREREKERERESARGTHVEENHNINCIIYPQIASRCTQHMIASMKKSPKSHQHFMNISKFAFLFIHPVSNVFDEKQDEAHEPECRHVF